MQEFSNKVAVVTGAASGIGRAVAERFATLGMKLVLADIEATALQATAAALEKNGAEVLAVPTDVSDLGAIQALADATMNEYGQVNVLHNNAGVVVSGPIQELSIADWEWVLGVDLWSVIYGIKVFLPLLEASGVGHVINTASTAGLQSAANIAPYNVAKFGVVAASETLRMELKARQSQVSCSVLCPGAVNTQIVTSARNRSEDSAAQHASSQEEERFSENAGKLLKEQGLAPADVANMIVAAMEKDEFWILTHPEWKNVLQERVRMLKESNQLHTGFGG